MNQLTPQINDVTISGNGFEYTFLPNGDWLWKAVPLVKKVKNEYREEPHFKVVYQIEDRFKLNFNRCLANAVKDITKYLA